MVWAEKFRPWEFWGKSVWMGRTNLVEIKPEGYYKTSREANWKISPKRYISAMII
jgi:hypothetical protein